MYGNTRNLSTSASFGNNNSRYANHSAPMGNVVVGPPGVVIVGNTLPTSSGVYHVAPVLAPGYTTTNVDYYPSGHIRVQHHYRY